MKYPVKIATLALIIGLGMPALALASSDTGTSTTDMNNMDMGSMDMGSMAAGPTVPPVHGFVDGEPILFIHTEISDAAVAKILTDMMGGSPVPVVPSLALAPPEMLAPVYVFTNGYSGAGPMGPLGGQPDIFDKYPGQEGYSPLRNVILATWADGANVEMLMSLDTLNAAIDAGSITTKEAGIVVNMPFLIWPGGTR
jgi:hypothetical protein